jgi:hypothetical protein
MRSNFPIQCNRSDCPNGGDKVIGTLSPFGKAVFFLLMAGLGYAAYVARDTISDIFNFAIVIVWSLPPFMGMGVVAILSLLFLLLLWKLGLE